MDEQPGAEADKVPEVSQETADKKVEANHSDANSAVPYQRIQQLKVRVQAVLGTVPLSVSQLANLSKGDLIELDTKIGDPIEILANGDVIALAEIVVTPDEPPSFGLSLTKIVEASGNPH